MKTSPLETNSCHGSWRVPGLPNCEYSVKETRSFAPCLESCIEVTESFLGDGTHYRSAGDREVVSPAGRNADPGGWAYGLYHRAGENHCSTGRFRLR